MSTSENNIFKQVTDSLSSIFRHIIPGIIITFIGYCCFPGLFERFSFDGRESNQLIILTAIVIAVGNFWYAFHRYTFHQVMDWVMYLKYIKEDWKETPRKTPNKENDYSDWIMHQSIESFKYKKENSGLINMIHARSSYHILLFISFEALTLFSFFITDTSILKDHKLPAMIIGFGGLILSCTIWYYIPWKMTVTVNRDLKAKYGPVPSPTNSSNPAQQARAILP